MQLMFMTFCSTAGESNSESGMFLHLHVEFLIWIITGKLGVQKNFDIYPHMSLVDDLTNIYINES